MQADLGTCIAFSSLKDSKCSDNPHILKTQTDRQTDGERGLWSK